eukprot:m.198569 g.198569  ORF g.198569 m.198569 type:complete len:763 (+) comp39562_c0_seq2:161-2449(+)
MVFNFMYHFYGADYDVWDHDVYDSDSDDDYYYSMQKAKQEKQRRTARDGRRQKAEEMQQTHTVRQQLAVVFQLSKDTSSYLSLLPHELATSVLNHCGFAENDVRLVAKGFDKVGLRVRVVLPVRGKGEDGSAVAMGRVTEYDANCDQHIVRLASGENVKIQMDGIGRNGYRVEFDDTARDLVVFPSQPSEITLEWMKEKFSEFGLKALRLEVSEVVFPPLEGDTCQACKVVLDCEGDSGNPDLAQQMKCFIKFGLSSANEKDFPVNEIWASGCHEREAYFYSRLRTKTKQPIAPECYYACCNPERRQSVIVLEDLSSSHTACIQEITQVQLRQALLSLAVLHSSFWETQSLSEHFADVNQGSMKHIATTPLPILSSHLESALRHLLSALPSTIAYSLEFLVQNVRFLYFWFASRPITLTHSDVRPTNLFFPSDRDSPALMVDWQHCQPGVPIRDLAKLLAFGCVSQREGEHLDLIKFYCSKLNGFIGCDTRKEKLLRFFREQQGLYPPEPSSCYIAFDVYDDYRLYLLLHMLELAVFIDLAESGDRQDAFRELLQRVANTSIVVRSFDLFQEMMASRFNRRFGKQIIPAPNCLHGIAAVRRQTKGKDKYFFGCPHYDTGEECSFFNWTKSTDLSQKTGAPVCIAHKKVAYTRYSLKPETLGKAYYCCSLEGNDRCRLFRWVEDGKGSSQATAGSRGRTCHYWRRNGVCRYGDRCRFVHSDPVVDSGSMTSGSSETPQEKCRYWESGRSCPYGQRCYFVDSHV